MGAPSSNSVTAARRSACAPRVSSSRSARIRSEVAAAQCSRLARLARRVAAASTGSSATGRIRGPPREAACSSSTHASWGSSATSAPRRKSSRPRGDSSGHRTSAAPCTTGRASWCTVQWRKAATARRVGRVTTPQPPVEHLDVLVVGAGISGIGAGRYLRTELPAKSFAILEARAASGGTWDLFRYPGIRSDSDLHTFGYDFKPWRDEQSIADAPRILAYLRETITENGLDVAIRYSHRVLAASWSTADARWTVDVERTDTGERLQLSAGWLFCAGGYYRYDEGFTPVFPGRERFRGPIVHPQHWPEDLDYAGKRVLVIGSGATAVTLVPAMAETAGHVTMLQRTPSYVMHVPRNDALADRLRALLGEERGFALTRRKTIALGIGIW